MTGGIVSGGILSEGDYDTGALRPFLDTRRSNYTQWNLSSCGQRREWRFKRV